VAGVVQSKILLRGSEVPYGSQRAICPSSFTHPWSACFPSGPTGATSDEVKQLRAEARQLKEALAEVTLENRLLKKSVIADGEDIA
jgi:hypothetical protein